MKSVRFLFFALLFLAVLAACAGAPAPAAQPTSIRVSPTPQATATFAPLPTIALGDATIPELTPETVQTPEPVIPPTVAVQPTQTPRVITVVVTATPSAKPATTQADGECTYKATFLGDVNVPDNTVILGGSNFEKIWRIRNDGTCSWGSAGFALHSLVLTGGNLSGPASSVEIPNAVVDPGQTIEVQAPLVAPTNPGTYKSEWKLRVDNSPSGPLLVGVGPNGATPLYAQIVVPAIETPIPTGSRISFAAGATEAVVTGTLAPGVSEDYTINAGAGQTMMLTLNSPVSGNVQMRVLGPGETTPTVIRTSPDGTYWLGTLPATGDYTLRVTAPGSGSNFSLEVVIPQRITFLPGAISDLRPGTSSARRTVTYLLKASAGQTMTVSLETTSPNVATISIYGLNDGIPLVRAVSGATSWTGVLPATQDYVIEVVPSVDRTFGFAIKTTVQ